MKIRLLFLFAAIFLFPGCQQDPIIVGPPVSDNTVRSLSKGEMQIVEADQSFAFNLMNQLTPMDTSKNLFISPLSVSYAFGMALNGASGSTYDAIRNVLELQGLSEQVINESFNSLMALLMNLDDQVIFEIANSIWYKDDFPVLDAFLQVNKKYFDAEVRSMDFSNPTSVNIINGWAADKTHDKIKEVLDEIPPNVVMYLINAIYFKATWLHEFDKTRTTEENFYLDGQATRPCQLMKMTDTLDYYVDDNLQAVTLPYGDDYYQMTVILPSSTTDIDAFASTFTFANWTTMLSNMSHGIGTVELPKFKTEYKLLMNDVLKAMGMQVAFTAGQADFSRITAANDIYISRVIHNTFVQVDEEGTEAAAVTVIEFERLSGGSTLDFHMKVNRPFYFVIHEKQSGTILFMGKIKQPQWTE
ncbi:serpin family protein [candidate division KSB1 bacterium]|nr:serpin family protein [candidate division KSB1 bacterium]